MSLYYFKIFLKFHWGFLLNYHGFTKSRPALKIIPPTTLIGALAYGLNLNKGETYNNHSGAERIRDIIESVNAKIDIPLIEYSDLSRIFSYKLREKNIITDAAAIGKVYTTPLKDIEIIYIIDEHKAKNVLGSSWLKELILSAWSISRLGSRESITSVSRIEYGAAELYQENYVETSFYFPLRVSKNITGTYSILNLVDWIKTPVGDYTKAEKIPVVFPYDWTKMESTVVRVELKNGINAIRAGKDIIIPWKGGKA